ncbi:MAG: CS1 type fimbrial major subunit [Kluyvera sp.]
MKTMMKPLMAALCLTLAGSAFAVQKDITVTANVDASIDMTMSDNSALPKAVEMQYIPGNGLQTYNVGMTKIWSNATDSTAGDVHMRLVSPAQLVNNVGASASPVPLTVKWGNGEITTTDMDLKTSDIFPNGADAVKTGSIAKALTIAQTTQNPLETGTYQGVVSIYLYQDASTAP